MFELSSKSIGIESKTAAFGETGLRTRNCAVRLPDDAARGSDKVIETELKFPGIIGLRTCLIPSMKASFALSLVVMTNFDKCAPSYNGFRTPSSLIFILAPFDTAPGRQSKHDGV